MRIGESLLLLSTLCAVLEPASLGHLAALSSATTLVAHLVIEGPRWQLGPAYAAICCFALGRPRSRLATAALCLSVVVSALLAITLPVFSLPRSGPFVVGTRTIEIVDNQQAWFKGLFREMRGRPLQIQLWYPTSHATESEARARHREAPYLPGLSARGGVYAKEMGGPAWLLSHLGAVRTRAFEDAPLVAASSGASRLPVVLYSHGHTGTRSLAQAALLDLASRGFVVAAVDHTFDSKLVAFGSLQGMVLDEVPRTPNVTWDEKRAECAQELRARVGDMRATMRALEALDSDAESPFHGRLYLDAVTGVGHSFGAATVLMHAREDRRVKAALTLDGWWWPMPDELLNGSVSVGVPTTVIQAAAFIGQSTEPSYRYNHAQARAMVEALQRERTPALLATLPGTRHVDYIDVALISPLFTRLIGATGERSGYQMQRIVADAAHASAVEYALRDRLGADVLAPQPVVSMEAARREMEPADFV